MEQYISKSDLVTKIEKLNPPFYPTLAEKMSYQDATKDCIDIIYTIEVKEILDEYDGVLGKELKMVDDEIARLEKLKVKEVDLDKHLKEDIEDVLFDLDGVAVKGATHYLTVEDIKDIARHFFKLGMVAGNKTNL